MLKNLFSMNVPVSRSLKSIRARSWGQNILERGARFKSRPRKNMQTAGKPSEPSTARHVLENYCQILSASTKTPSVEGRMKQEEGEKSCYYSEFLEFPTAASRAYVTIRSRTALPYTPLEAETLSPPTSGGSCSSSTPPPRRPGSSSRTWRGPWHSPTRSTSCRSPCRACDRSARTQP